MIGLGVRCDQPDDLTGFSLQGNITECRPGNRPHRPSSSSAAVFSSSGWLSDWAPMLFTHSTLSGIFSSTRARVWAGSDASACPTAQATMPSTLSLARLPVRGFGCSAAASMKIGFSASSAAWAVKYPRGFLS